MKARITLAVNRRVERYSRSGDGATEAGERI
jgi:hypothetical protein